MVHISTLKRPEEAAVERLQAIGVFGSSRTRPGEPAYELGIQLGREVARAGWAVCNGGYGGTMEASAKGARQVGGHTIGISCTAFGRGGVNAYIQEEISTDGLQQRLETLLQRCDGYIVLPGGTGTLVELAMTWELQNKRLTPCKPLVALGDFWRAAIDTVLRDDPAAAANIQLVPTVPEAIEAVRRALEKRSLP